MGYKRGYKCPQINVYALNHVWHLIENVINGLQINANLIVCIFARGIFFIYNFNWAPVSPTIRLCTYIISIE